MKDSLKQIISLIVDTPEEVKVEETEENGVHQFSVSVAKEDIGKVIGKNGKIIRAIRNVMKIPAIKAQQKIYISVADTDATS